MAKKTTNRRDPVPPHIITHIDANIYHLEKSRTVVKMEAETDSTPNTYVQPRDYTESVKLSEKKAPALKLKMSAWTTQNNWPQVVLEKLSTASLAKRALKVRMEDMYGKGLMLYTLDYADQKRGFNFLNPTEPSYKLIHEFLKRNNYKRFLKKTIRNIAYFDMRVTEMVVDSKAKIATISAKDLDCCRFGYDSTGAKWLVYSSEYRKGQNTPALKYYGDDKNAEAIPVLPEDYLGDVDMAKKWVADNKLQKFAVVSVIDSLGRDTYQDADWHAIIRTKAIDQPNNIAKYKNAIMDNQMTVKYAIIVAEEYFQTKYGDEWGSMKPEDKQKKRESFLETIDEVLAGAENAAKSIMIPAIAGQNGELIRYIKIEEISNNFNGSSLYIADLDSANNVILKAIGVNPAKIGHGAVGTQMGAGSGSDIREAQTVDSNSHQFSHDMIVEDLEFVRDYNGYDPEIQFGFPQVQLTTLDRNPTGQQTMM